MANETEIDYTENPFWQSISAVKKNTPVGKLVRIKSAETKDKWKVGMVRETSCIKGQGKGNYFLKIMLTSGEEVEINWRAGGYEIRVASVTDFLSALA